MKLAFYNPSAGRGGAVSAARRSLAALADTQMIATLGGDRTIAQVRNVLTPDVDAVFACGGDGTVCDVAAGLAGSSVPLCIVPCGTTNVLAREFGIPLNPAAAVRFALSTTTTVPVSTWMANSRHLVLGAGIGWDARLMHHASPTLKRRFGFAGLLPAAMKIALRYDFPSLHVAGIGANGEQVRLAGTSIIVSNTKRWNGANPGFTTADPGDDLLDVIVLQRSSLAHLMKFWTLVTVPGGRPLSMEGVASTQLRSLTVTSDHPSPQQVHVNGDAAGTLPLTITAGALVRVRAAS